MIRDSSNRPIERPGRFSRKRLLLGGIPVGLIAPVAAALHQTPFSLARARCARLPAPGKERVDWSGLYSTKRAGSGLGLPLCREIVEAHGGEESLERRDGGGTVVTCWLPGALPE